MKGSIACCFLACGAMSVACSSSTNAGVGDDTMGSGSDSGIDGARSDGGVGVGSPEAGIDGNVSTSDGPSTSDVVTTMDGSTVTDGPAGDAPATTTPLPALSVSGNLIKDSTGKTVVLRGVAIPDIGSLDVAAGGSTGVSARIDEILGAAMLDANVIRMPVYPETTFNGTSPYYSPEPFPVGTAAAATAMPVPIILSATDFINNVLKPAVTYAESKNLYVIIDYHQIDNVTSHNSGADAVTFWTAIAPVFANDPNVLYEAFNEPVDTTDGITAGNWSTTFLAAAQSWVTAIRAGAPNTLIIMGSPSWSQYPSATSGLTDKNLAFTAHEYPGNWPGTAPKGGGTTFQGRVDTAAMTVPIFMTEWGFTTDTTQKTNTTLYTMDDTWGNTLKTDATMTGASWTAWVADPSWGPPMFANPSATMLTDFGTFVQTWLQSAQ
jgi:hypothetical protein